MRLAAIDLGSNSFHLLVVDASADGHFVPLARDKEVLRLGDMVSREGRITEAGLAKAVDTIRRFKTQADSLGVTELMACATSAIRDADNGGEVIDAIYAATGVRVGLLSGLEEARLVFQAVRASVVIDPGPALCLDLGGGSLEVMVGGPEGLLKAVSLPLGVGRLTTELVRDDPPSGDDVRRLRQRLTATLAPVAEEMAGLRATMAVATSGTLSDLGRMALARREGVVPMSLNQVAVTREELEELHADIMSSTVGQRTKMAGLDARRADQIPAGSMVAVVAMELFGIRELTMSAWALREGIILEVIGRADPALWTSDAHLIRRSSVLGLARRCNWDEAHSRHVARLATDLFDATTSLHGLGPDDREMLDHAALLHDIGHHVAHESHHKHTAYLVQHGRLRGYDPEEVDALACLARYHRRGDPKPSHEPFATLGPDRQEQVTKLAALLRLADGLDFSHTGTVTGVDVRIDDARVRIAVTGTGDLQMELWGARRKRQLFEKVYDRRLEFAAATPDRKVG
ncbi:MAG: exopolyphosphatase / guanosine-5-triphosphate,3-diphosphate pyrophosphatase [Actinomycetota bacterium]|jgi:exopolyphosphatase/guanosine-5'-triphosphate,3'-diphosphate pyrophosphatase|nr:exopolyphosphatase / guanosine-5-triphosphate,3-diphosphate pyrophosphatase [Actinomycetota bacterium]